MNFVSTLQNSQALSKFVAPYFIQPFTLIELFMKKLTLLAVNLLIACVVQAQCDFNITVNGAVVSPFLCSEDLPAQLVPTNPGGTFSGPGVIGDIFNPVPMALPDIFEITYTLAGPPDGPCSTSIFIQVDVATVEAMIAPLPSTFVCENDAPFPLVGNVPSGSFTINDMLVTEFDPTFWGTGSHTVMYSVTDPMSGCVSIDTETINVLATPDVSFTGLEAVYCIGDQGTVLQGAAVSGDFSGSGITGVFNNTFDPALAGLGTHAITFSYSDLICSHDTTVMVEVVDFLMIDFTSITTSTCYTEPDTLVYSGDALSASSVFDWSIDSDGIIAYNGGDTIVVNWANPGNQMVTLSIESTSCIMADVTQMLPKSGLLIETIEDQIVTFPSDTELTTSITSGSPQGVSFLWQPSEGLSCADCQNPIASPGQSTTYTVTATDAAGCFATDSVRLTVTVIDEVFIPNAFTPNDDGKNDNLLVYGVSVTAATLQIFDRWGEKIYLTNDLGYGWDGTYKGQKANSGVYIYHADITLADGQKIFKTGNVTLIR